MKWLCPSEVVNTAQMRWHCSGEVGSLGPPFGVINRWHINTISQPQIEPHTHMHEVKRTANSQCLLILIVNAYHNLVDCHRNPTW